MEFDDHYRQAQRATYDCLLFDLDDTLYPLSSGIATECRKNIGDYMHEKLGIEESKIPELCDVLYKNYGTTMAGLRAIGYDFDYDDYHSFVHGRLPYNKLKPDPVLRQLLLSLPMRKVVFTNGDEVHAAEVLKKLGLEDCFEGVICFETLNPPSSSCGTQTSSKIFDIVDHFSKPDTSGIELPKTPVLCKPSVEAMEHALRLANIDPQRSVFFDDSARNIRSGKRIGLQTVLVGLFGMNWVGALQSSSCPCPTSLSFVGGWMQVGTSHRVKGADHALESIHNIREALPELWEKAEKSGSIRHSGKVAMETSVTA